MGVFGGNDVRGRWLFIPGILWRNDKESERIDRFSWSGSVGEERVFFLEVVHLGDDDAGSIGLLGCCWATSVRGWLASWLPGRPADSFFCLL